MNAFTEQKLAGTGGARGQVTGLQLAPIVALDELGRAKVALPASGGKSTSPWLWKSTQANGLTFPQYTLGDTLLYGYVDGDPHKGVQIAIVQNSVNPPSPLDQYTLVKGDCEIVITDDMLQLTVGDAVVKITNGTVELSGLTSFKINGKEVATVGAGDSRGDHLTSRGW